MLAPHPDMCQNIKKGTLALKTAEAYIFMDQIFSISSLDALSGCTLRAVYNTYTYGKYTNVLLEDDSISSCLLITLEGTGSIILKDKTVIKLPEKSMYVGTHSDIHSLNSTSDTWHFCCYWFNPVAINHSRNIVLPELISSSSEEDAFATEIINLISTGNSNDIKYANALFTCKILKLKPYEANVATPSSKLFQDVITYINRNLKIITSIKDIANHFAYSEKHLRSIFKTYAKTSPKQYIQKLKLDQICILLKTSSMSLQEMVELFNFCSLSHLISSFKKEYGVTPTQYKNQPSIHTKKAEVNA